MGVGISGYLAESASNQRNCFIQLEDMPSLQP